MIVLLGSPLLVKNTYSGFGIVLILRNIGKPMNTNNGRIPVAAYSVSFFSLAIFLWLFPALIDIPPVSKM
jgi:hypothetical protein